MTFVSGYSHCISKVKATPYKVLYTQSQQTFIAGVIYVPTRVDSSFTTVSLILKKKIQFMYLMIEVRKISAENYSKCSMLENGMH